MTNTTTTEPVVFIDKRNHWVHSVPTSIGFSHIDLGTLNTCPTKADAIARAHELTAR